MTTTNLLVRTLLLSNLVACVAPDDTPTTMEPVTTFTSKTGTTIELFASRSGYSAVEHGDATLAHALGPNDVAMMSPTELYGHASGTIDVPLEVAAMSANHGPLGSIAPIARDLPPVTADSLSGCSSSAFKSAGYCPAGDFDWCLLNWWNGAYEHLGDTWYSNAYLCVVSGSVLWQIQNGEGGFHQWTASTGEFYHYYFYDGLDSSWLYYDILQASGDEFQFGGMGYNN